MSLEEILALDEGCAGCPVCQHRLPRARRLPEDTRRTRDDVRVPARQAGPGTMQDRHDSEEAA